VTANHRDLVPCNLTEMWLPVTGIWYGALWQKCGYQSQGFGTVQSDRNVTANHRDLVLCTLTEMWQPITGIRYRALWQKCDSQSQGFVIVHCDRNVTANHRDSVPWILTEIWLPITVISWRVISQKYGSLSRECVPSFLAFKNTLVWSWSQQVSPNVSFSQTIYVYIRKFGIFHRHGWKKLKSHSFRLYWTVTAEDDWELQM